MTEPDPRLRELRLRRYAPHPSLRRRLTDLGPPIAPMIDAHCHPGRWLTDGWGAPDVDGLLARMDELGVVGIVNLDGMWGAELEAHLDRYDRAAPRRFATFTRLDTSLIETGG